MEWFFMILILFPMFHAFSYAKYCLRNNNKAAAWGTVILAITSVILPGVLMGMR